MASFTYLRTQLDFLCPSCRNWPYHQCPTLSFLPSSVDLPKVVILYPSYMAKRPSTISYAVNNTEKKGMVMIMPPVNSKTREGDRTVNRTKPRRSVHAIVDPNANLTHKSTL